MHRWIGIHKLPLNKRKLSFTSYSSSLGDYWDDDSYIITEVPDFSKLNKFELDKIENDRRRTIKQIEDLKKLNSREGSYKDSLTNGFTGPYVWYTEFLLDSLQHPDYMPKDAGNAKIWYTPVKCYIRFNGNEVQLKRYLSKELGADIASLFASEVKGSENKIHEKFIKKAKEISQKPYYYITESEIDNPEWLK